MTSTAPFLIVHATDLRPEGGAAFTHAVALARDLGATLHSLHACGPGQKTRPMPVASELLASWSRGAEPPVVEHRAVVHTCCEDPVDTMLDYLRDHHPDLLVVGTQRATGLARVMHGSVAESLARNVDVPTLFVPIGFDGFVAADDGAIDLGCVVIPSADAAFARRGAEVLDGLFARAGGFKDVDVVFLHVGDGPPLAVEGLPERPGVTWRVEERDGDLVDAVVDCIAEHRVGLVVMPTRGHDSLRDVVLGSHTERVMHAAPCPLLSIPA